MMIIETKRLLLRPLIEENLNELCHLQADPVVMKYLGHGPRTPEEVKSTLKRCIDHEQQFGFGLCAVIEKETQQFIGRAGLIHLGLDGNEKDIEIAFVFKATYWNQGYGYEIARGLMDWWFENPTHQEVVAVARIENVPCIKLLEKIGMQFKRKQKYTDIENVGYYSVSREQYMKLT